ncbi:uncharacterized protein LOC105208860 [Zeugodacus cucurbitae]|uniref:uncharacterized protein LOC105208860 n=1 Tax=Zeugodacus cucurbitae TaxID=28588 RepID=UPI0023D952B6|nr:uncharacterized protein LOC105208860 [Zeugodacus cucurbitae]
MNVNGISMFSFSLLYLLKPAVSVYNITVGKNFKTSKMKLPQKEVECKVQTLPPSPEAADAPESTEDSELLLKMLLDAFWKLWAQLKLVISFVMFDLGGYQLIDRLVQWSVRNPHTAICIVAAFLAFLLPFLIMLGIGLSTLLMTLTGFLVLEGVILSIIAMLLIGCLGSLILVVLFFKQLNRIK